MSEPEPSDLDSDLRLRLSQPMLNQSLRPVADEEGPGGTLVMDEGEMRQAQERDAATAGARLPKHMSGPQEWVLLPLSDAPEGIIGVGGEGVVYSYVQRELGREVAVKTLRADRWSYEAIESLLREACVTARLEHPNIVPVHHLHLPEHDSDSAYWVMKRVQGKPLTEHLPSGTDPWSIDKLLDVFRRALDAVAFAHSKGIVHRDLKPDNILVGEFGEVQVTDWGLAVAINEEGARGAAPLLRDEEAHAEDAQQQPRLGRAGAEQGCALSGDLAKLNESVRSGRVGALLNSSAGGRAGTPIYMAPEQLDLVAGNVDERTDVFLLGGILYAILTGQAPHQLEAGEDTHAVGQRLAQIRSCSTIRPVADVRRERGLSDAPEELSQAALDGLSDISKKALSPEPRDRFRSVAAFETALDEWESRSESCDLLEEAHVRWKEAPRAGRRRARYYAEVVALASTALEKWPANDEARGLHEEASTTLSKIQYRSTVRLWTATGLAVLLFVVLTSGTIRIRAEYGRAEEARKAAKEQQRAAEQSARAAELRRQEAETARTQAEAARAEADKRREEANTERDKALHEAYFASVALADQKIREAYTGDAERLLDACPEHLRSWEWGHLKRLCHPELLTLMTHLYVQSVAFSPDGQRIASACNDRTVKVWDATNGRYLLTLREHGSIVNSVAFSPDGQRIASGSVDKTVKVWDAANGREVMTLRGHKARVGSVTFSPGGERIASASLDKTVKVWDAANGREVLTLKGHASEANAVAFSPEGERIASGSTDKTVRIWDGATGREVLTLRGHDSGVSSVAFSSDGRRIASGGWDRAVKVWDAGNGREVLTFRGHHSPVSSVAFSPDGQRIASASEDRPVRVSNAATGREGLTLKGHDSWVSSVAFSPDSQRIASGSTDRSVKVWDAATGREVLVFRGHGSSVYDVTFSPDGRRIASRSWAGPDAGNGDSSVRVWDAANGAELLTFRGHDYSSLGHIALSPDGRRIVSADDDGTVRVWDAMSGRKVLSLRGHDSELYCAAFSHDGQRLAAGAGDGSVRIWDAANGRPVAIFRGHGQPVISIAFSPDGQRIVSASRDKTVRLWDPVSGREALTLKGHDSIPCSVAFSPDGRRIAAGRIGNVIEVWDRTPVLKSTEFSAGAQRGEAKALYHLALIRELHCRDADARKLHERSAEVTTPAQAEWAERSRRRLTHLPWLQSWWPAYSRIVACLESGDFDDGIREYRAMPDACADVRRRLADRFSKTLIEQGHQQFIKQNRDSAERLYRLAIELGPAEPSAHFRLGRVLSARGDNTGAIQQYRQAIEADAGYVPAHFDLVRLLEKGGEHREAVGVWRACVALARDRPPGRLAVHSCARLLVKLGRKNDAVRELREYVQKYPQVPDTRAELAALLCSLGRSKEAGQALGPLLSEKEPDTKAHFAAALCSQALGKDEEARSHVATVTEREPSDWRATNAIADLLELGVKLRKPLEGLLHSDDTLYVRFDASLAWGYANGLASRLSRRDEKAEAADACRTALKIAPDRADVQQVAGFGFQHLSMYDEAVGCFSKAVELAPGSGAAHGNLGWALYLTGRHDEAMAASLRALELVSKLAFVHANVGLLHVLKQDLDKAMPSYKRAVDLDLKQIQRITIRPLLDLLKKRPEIVEAHYALGFWYERKGDQAKAREHYQKHVDATKEGKFVELAKERIKVLAPK